jgi:phosphoglycolate phosphatase
MTAPGRRAAPALDAIVFDKDGTLFDFRRTWGGWTRAVLAGLSAGDPARARVLGARIGFDPEAPDATAFADDSPVIAGTADEIAAILLPALPGQDGAALVARMNALAARIALVEAVPLRRVLPALSARGLRLGLATNDAEAPARAHLAAAGVLDLFDFVAGYDSGHGAKPGAGQLLAFARHAGIAPHRIAMVGDSLHDLAAGRAAGMATVGVLTGPAGRATLAPHADAVLDDIGLLGDWLDGGRGT